MSRLAASAGITGFSRVGLLAVAQVTADGAGVRTPLQKERSAERMLMRQKDHVKSPG